MFLIVSTIAGKKLQAFYLWAVILFLVFSCKEKEKIGLEVQPDNQIGVVFTDTVTLSMETVLYNDSIVTSDEGYLLTGAYNDDVFGKVYADAYAEFVQNAESKDVTGFGAIDSVVLNLNYIYFYGDSNQFQTIKVYELTDKLYKDSVYKSIETNKIPSYNPTALDLDQPFKARPSTKRQKVKLDNSFGTRILNEIGSGKNNTDFKATFKGLGIFPKNNNEGGVMALDLINNGTRVSIYFKKSSGDRDSVILIANPSQARFHTITSDRQGTTLSSLVKDGDFKPSLGELYLQAGVGIRSRVRIPSLSTFKEKIGNVAINRAELVITDENYDASNPIESQPIPYLRLLKLNADGSLRKTTSPSTYNNVPIVMDNLLVAPDPYSVGFNKTTKTYSFNISSFVHSAIHGIEANNGFIISTPPTANKLSVNRLFAPAGNVKLKIWYTKVN